MRSYVNDMVCPALKRRGERKMNQLEQFMRISQGMKRSMSISDIELFKMLCYERKHTSIKSTENMIYIIFAFIIINYVERTLIVCNHVDAIVLRRKAKKILNHNCGIDSSLEICSSHELNYKFNMYHSRVWNRIIYFKIDKISNWDLLETSTELIIV
jgi:hypothetical protein